MGSPGKQAKRQEHSGSIIIDHISEVIAAPDPGSIGDELQPGGNQKGPSSGASQSYKCGRGGHEKSRQSYAVNGKLPEELAANPVVRPAGGGAEHGCEESRRGDLRRALAFHSGLTEQSQGKD